jgi:hypothetical protein
VNLSDNTFEGGLADGQGHAQLDISAEISSAADDARRRRLVVGRLARGAGIFRALTRANPHC